MKIDEEIKKMKETVQNVLLDKFLLIDVLKCDEKKSSYEENGLTILCDLQNDDVVLKIITNDKNGTEFRYSLNWETKKIEMTIWEVKKNSFGNMTSSAEKIKIIYKLSNAWFTNKRNKQIYERAQDIFDIKTHKHEYKKLKSVLNENFDLKDIRKIKLEALQQAQENN